jgi:hypothetical protein
MRRSAVSDARHNIKFQPTIRFDIVDHKEVMGRMPPSTQANESQLGQLAAQISHLPRRNEQIDLAVVRAE